MLDGVESHTQSQSQYQWCREPSQSKGRFSQASHQTPGNGELPLHGSRHISRQELVHYGTFPQRSIGFTLHSWVLLLVTLSVCLVVLGELTCAKCNSGIGPLPPCLQGILKTLSLGSLEGCAMKPTQMFEKAQSLLLPEKQLNILFSCCKTVVVVYLKHPGVNDLGLKIPSLYTKSY